MSPGSTRTGGVLEEMVLPALRHGGYECKVQVNIGKRLGLGAHMVDFVASEGRAQRPDLREVAAGLGHGGAEGAVRGHLPARRDGLQPGKLREGVRGARRRGLEAARLLHLRRPDQVH